MSNKTKKESGAMDLEALKETVEETLDDNKTFGNNKTFGVVVNCQSLNVRHEASLDSNVASSLRVDSEVIIYEDASTEDFYKVCTSAGVEGYCAREYISIK